MHLRAPPLPGTWQIGGPTTWRANCLPRRVHASWRLFASSVIVPKGCRKNVVFRFETLETKPPETTNSRDSNICSPFLFETLGVGNTLALFSRIWFLRIDMDSCFIGRIFLIWMLLSIKLGNCASSRSRVGEFFAGVFVSRKQSLISR